MPPGDNELNLLLTTDDSDLLQGLNRSQAALNTFAAQVNTSLPAAAKSMGEFGAASRTVGAGLGPIAKRAMESGAAMAAMEKQIAMSTKAIESLLTANRNLTSGLTQTRSQLTQTAQAAQATHQQVSKLPSALDSTTSSLLGMARNVSAIALVSKGFADATRAAIEFDGAMRNVDSITSMSESKLQSLGNSLRKIGTQTGAGAAEAARSAYDVYSSGISDPSRVQDVVGTSLRASLAGQTDSATSTQAIVGVMNAYGQEAMSAQHASDVLFQTVNKGVVTFGELARFMGPAVGVAASAGIRFEELSGVIATMTTRGIRAPIAIDGIKAAIIGLMAPTDEAKKEMAAWHLTINEQTLKADGLIGTLKKLEEATGGDAEAMRKILGDSSALVSVLSLLKDHGAAATDSVRDMDHAMGALDSAFGKIEKAVGTQWKFFTAALEDAGIAMGTTFLPMLSEALKTGTAFLKFFADMDPAVRAALTSLVGMGVGIAATKGTLEAAGGAMQLFGSLSAAASAKAGKAAAEQVGGLSKVAETAEVARGAFESYEDWISRTTKAEKAAAAATEASANVFTRAGTAATGFKNTLMAIPFGPVAIGLAAISIALVTYTEHMREANAEAARQLDIDMKFANWRRQNRDLFDDDKSPKDLATAGATKLAQSRAAAAKELQDLQTEMEKLTLDINKGPDRSKSVKERAEEYQQIKARLTALPELIEKQKAQVAVLQQALQISQQTTAAEQKHAANLKISAANSEDLLRQITKRANLEKMTAAEHAALIIANLGKMDKASEAYKDAQMELIGLNKQAAAEKEREAKAAEKAAKAAEKNITFLERAVQLQKQGGNSAQITGKFHDWRTVSQYRSVAGEHLGYDISGEKGKPVYAAEGGRVTGITPWLADRSQYGVSVAGEQTGYTSTYGHIMPTKGLAEGQVVKEGQQIGTIVIDHVDIKTKDASGRYIDMATQKIHSGGGKAFGESGGLASAEKLHQEFTIGFINLLKHENPFDKARTDLKVAFDKAVLAAFNTDERVRAGQVYAKKLEEIGEKEQAARLDGIAKLAEATMKADSEQFALREILLHAELKKNMDEVGSLLKLGSITPAQAEKMRGDLAISHQGQMEKLDQDEAEAPGKRQLAEGNTLSSQQDQIYESQMQTLEQLRKLRKISHEEEIAQLGLALNAHLGNDDVKRQRQLEYMDHYRAYLQLELDLQGENGIAWLQQQAELLQAAGDQSDAATARLNTVQQMLADAQRNRLLQQRQQFQQFADGVGANVAGFLTGLITEHQKFSDAFKNMWKGIANAVIQEIERMIAKMIAMKIIEFGLGILSGGTSTAAMAATNTQQMVMGATFGGGGPSLIHFPGAELLHDGGWIPRYHDGGAVGNMPAWLAFATGNLKPGEVPIIAKYPEYVLSEQMLADGARTYAGMRSLEALPSLTPSVRFGDTSGGGGRRGGEQPPINLSLNFYDTQFNHTSDVDGFVRTVVDRAGDELRKVYDGSIS